MELQDKYIRFDWAVKRLLRHKANFGVLEGFLTVLLGEDIHIIEILESESNQQTPEDKFNRVDIKARNSKDEIIIVEIQNTREIYYLERILYGVAKTITEPYKVDARRTASLLDIFATMQNGVVFWAGLTVDASSLADGVDPVSLVRFAIYPICIAVITLLSIQFNLFQRKDKAVS